MKSLHLDALAIIVSALLLLAYYLYFGYRVRRDPGYTIHSVNQKARVLWVAHIIKNPSKDVMAIQTLRNLMMAATFKGSSAILLIMGTLTLSGQAESLSRTWHVLNLAGSEAPEWWIIKIICLLTVLIVAFFSFAMVIRVLNHVIFMINLPAEETHGAMSPQNIAHRLNDAGLYYRIGMRAFFITVPLAFWLFGPVFLMAATVGLVIVLYYLDRSPLAEPN